jgi:hypothetical protein
MRSRLSVCESPSRGCASLPVTVSSPTCSQRAKDAIRRRNYIDLQACVTKRQRVRETPSANRPMMFPLDGQVACTRRVNSLRRSGCNGRSKKEIAAAAAAAAAAGAATGMHEASPVVHIFDYNNNEDGDSRSMIDGCVITFPFPDISASPKLSRQCALVSASARTHTGWCRFMKNDVRATPTSGGVW